MRSYNLKIAYYADSEVKMEGRMKLLLTYTFFIRWKGIFVMLKFEDCVCSADSKVKMEGRMQCNTLIKHFLSLLVVR